MAKITHQGEIPQPQQPWYLTQEMECPQCHTRFMLEAEDIADPDHQDRPWGIITERSLNGTSVATGPCPFCKATISIHRTPTSLTNAMNQGKVRAEQVYADVRASLPAGVTHVRWAKERGVKSGLWGRKGPQVVCFPGGPAGIIPATDAATHYHAIGRLDGQIRTDLLVDADGMWERWEGSTEAECATLDQELVDFVQRLRLVKTTMAQPGRGK